MYSQSYYAQATALRQAGYTYNYISERLGVPKSTLSDWLKDISYNPNQETKEKLGKARAVAAENRVSRRLQNKLLIRDEMRSELKDISSRDLFFLDLGLYWGEGSKTHDITRIVNSDPRVIQVSIKWFESMGIMREQFFVILHLYPDSRAEKCLQFWAETTNIPISQFGKVQIDRREKS